MSKSSKTRKCEYTYCIAAAINNKRAYYIRAIVFLIGLGAIIKSSSLFTFTNIALLLVPALTDNYYEIIKAFQQNILLWFDRIVKIINCTVIIMCILGEIGFITDTNTTFQIISTSLILGGFSVKKEFVAFVLLLDFFETLVMAVFVPGKFDNMIIDSSKEMQNKRNQTEGRGTA